VRGTPYRLDIEEIIMAASVLVGTDGSEAARLAVGWAADDAARRLRPLRIVHVRQLWHPPGQSGDEVLAVAADVARTHHPDLEIETRLTRHGLVESLLEQSVDTFEVVFGHSGPGSSSQTIRGAIGQWAGGRSAQPVVVTCGDTTSNHGQVVVGIDPLHDATDLLEYAFDTARLRQATLWIFHAWILPGRPTHQEHVSLLEDAEPSQTPSQFGLISDSWRERHPDVKVVERTICAGPVGVMVDASTQADLIIVGARDRRGSTEEVMRVRSAVLEQSRCPIAVVSSTVKEDHSLH
jgi:nucleotide-binding universal stress UspA family protein